MNAKLEFNLPEEMTDLKLAINSANMWSGICDFDNVLRKMGKHTKLSDDQHSLLKDLRDTWYEIFGTTIMEIE